MDEERSGTEEVPLLTLDKALAVRAGLERRRRGRGGTGCRQPPGRDGKRTPPAPARAPVIPVRLAVPEKRIRLTLLFAFFDRCGKSVCPVERLAANAVGGPWRSRPANGAAAEIASSLYLPPAARGRNPATGGGQALFPLQGRPWRAAGGYPHRRRQTQAEERKQARSAQRAAGMAQRLFFTPAAEKYTAAT